MLNWFQLKFGHKLCDHAQVTKDGDIITLQILIDDGNYPNFKTAKLKLFNQRLGWSVINVKQIPKEDYHKDYPKNPYSKSDEEAILELKEYAEFLYVESN